MQGSALLSVALVVVAAALAAPTVARAQAPAPASSEAPAAAPVVVVPVAPVVGGWRSAPIFGADVRSVVLHPADPDTLLAGTSAGQVYLSRDSGATWRDAGDGVALAGWVVSDLVFDPAWKPSRDPGDDAPPPRLWAALWGIWGSGTVLMSDDLGRTWKPRGRGLPDGQVYTLAAVAAGAGAGGGEGGAPARLYAGTRSGVYGSFDDGANWRPLTADLPEMQKVTSLLVEPAAPETVIAGTWRRAYRSDDGGLTWRGIFAGMALDSEVFSLQPVPGRPGEIWASTCGWVYQSRDGGALWQRHQEGLDTRRTPSFAVLASGRLLAGTTEGLYASDDGGRSWTLKTATDLAVLDITSRGGRVLLGTEGSGVWISDDGAETFRRSAQGMTNVRVAALVRAGRELLAAVNHAGPASGLYGSADGGATFALRKRLPTVLALTVAGYRVLAATERGLWERSGDDWRQIGELGDRRVEQVAAAGGRVVARTADALWMSDGGRFAATPYRHGPPRSAALFADALWVTDADHLYRLSAAANDTVESPLAGGRLERLAAADGDRLVLSGRSGVWLRGGSAGPWVELAAGEAAVRPTGDPSYPALLVGPAGAFLVEAGGSPIEPGPVEVAGLRDGTEPGAGLLHPLVLPVPARDVTAAALFDGKLVLGTSGYGLLVADFTPSSAGSATSTAAVSPAPAGSSPSATSSSAGGATGAAPAAGPKSLR